MLHTRWDFVFRVDGVSGTFRFAQGAIDAFVRVDHQKVGSFVKAIHGANIDAVGVLALDAVFGDYESHDGFPTVYGKIGLDTDS
jgi:hypothetical protein